MVQLLAAIGGAAFILTSLVMGVRLLLLARRTGELPELAVGLALFLMGGLAYPMIAVARFATPLPEGPRIALAGLALLLNGVGTVAVGVFNWRVFRPSEPWARTAVAALAVALAASLALEALTPGLRDAALHNRGAGLRAFFVLLGLPLAWASWESLRFHGLLLKRMRLGLGDPVVADRMWLWGISTLAAFVSNLATSVSSFFGVDIAVSTFGALLIAPLGLLAAGAMWLAFFPPESYLRRVAARAAASEA
jgi:hypothetical protein